MRSTSVQPSGLNRGETSYRWSLGSQLEERFEVPRGRTPSIPSYTNALIKSSQRLRERSMTPTRPLPPMPQSSPYKAPMDYYRGKVKSIYETEPLFKDFVRNIPLSERNLYDRANLTRLKKRFDNMVSERGDLLLEADPYNPTNDKGLLKTIYQPKADSLSLKHRSKPPGLRPLPCISCYHRSTRTRHI